MYSKRRKFYFGFQISLIRDRQGLKLETIIRLFSFHRDYEWVIRENPEWNRDYSHLTPKANDPCDLTEFPDTKPLEPEEI